jgi:serine/threonine-protein kinase HipA
MKMPDVSVLNVLLHGEKIGTLTHVGGDRTLFAFTDAYIANPQRPTLGLRFKDEFGDLITDVRPTQTRLMSWFSNLLPEGHLRTYLAERAGVNSEREFHLIRVLGRDLPGAVTIEPADGDVWLPDSLSGNSNSATVAKTRALRFSLAGVQLKFSAIQQALGGLTIPAKGIGGDWIIKLPSREFAEVPENEFSMMTLARAVGITVPQIRLIDVNAIGNLPEGAGALKGQAFAIQRFDRATDGAAIHIEDFAQVFDVYPNEKYRAGNMRSIARVLGAEGSEEDAAELARRIVFNALIGNADMHLKNWSLIYRDKRHAALAPAYDFVSTIPYLKDEEFALKFSRTKRYDELTLDELSHFAAKARLSEKLVLSSAKATVQIFREIWSQEKNNLPLGEYAVKAIDAHLKRVPLAHL